jgi:hypothetical protein
MKRQPMPCCGYVVDDATQIHGNAATPKDHDVMICLRCGTWTIVQGEGFRFFGPNDLLDYTDDQLANMRRATRLIRSGRFLRHAP